MSNYKNLLQQIAELQKQAEEARKDEIDRAYTQILTTMEEYGITPADVKLKFERKGKPKKDKAASNVAPKYRDPVSGKTWSGRGKRPVWCKPEHALPGTFPSPRVAA